MNVDNLPHKLQIRFLYECCLDIKHLLKEQRSLDALEGLDLWLRGKINHKDMKDLHRGAAYCIVDILNSGKHKSAAYGIAYACDAVFGAAFKHSRNTCIDYIASTLGLDSNEYFKDKLTKFINSLTDIEKELYNL